MKPSLLNFSSLTFWSGVGLIGLGCFQISQGDSAGGVAHITQGLTAIGLRRAIEANL